MRSTSVVLGWLTVGVVAFAGCGEETAHEGVAESDEPESSLPMVDGEPYLTCGGGDPAFPTSALRDGVDGLVDSAEMVDALDKLRVGFGIDAPRQLQESPASEVEWKVVAGDRAEDPTTVLVWIGRWPLPRGATDEYVRFERTEEGWQPDGWGECRLEPALADGAGWVEMTQPAGGLATDEAVVDVLVNERECASARDPRPFLHEPIIVERERTVTIYWTSESPKGEYQNCAGTAPVPAILRLDQPLGDRTLLDGSIWPARPVKPLPPWM